MRVVFSFLRTLLGLVSITANLIAAEQNGGPAGQFPPQQTKQFQQSAARRTPKWEPSVETAISGPSPDDEQFGSATIDPPKDIVLPNVRWQSLPDGVMSAAISPDQRTWYLLGGESGPRELPQSAIRTVVEREFAKPSPQLQGVFQVFFEAEGIEGPQRAKLKRVWLMCPFGRKLLLGYDGKRWIERRMKSGFFWEPDALRRSFLQFDGGVAFFEQGGCHVISEGKWFYHHLGVTFPSFNYRTWLEPDGKGLTAWIATDAGPRLWRFREGAWSERPWPEDRYAAARAAAPVKLGDHFYARVGLRTDRLTPPQRASMIRSKLLPEKPLVIDIGPDGQATELDAEGTLAVGRYKVPLRSAMWNDVPGTFYAGCGSAAIGSRKLGPGLLICGPSGKEARYVNVDSRSPVDVDRLGATPLFLDDGKRAWTAQGLLDLGNLTLLGHLPSKTYEVVAAAHGIAFAERIGGHYGGKMPQQMVYRVGAPEAADSRTHLVGQTVALNGPGYCIASDGSIWASRGDFGIERFDGATWRNTNAIRPGGSGDVGQAIRLTPFSLVPAQNGWVLTFVGHRVSDLHIERGFLDVPVFQPSFLLLNGQKCSGGRGFEKWIPECRDLFLEAFSAPSPHASWRAIRPEIAEQFGNNVTIKSTNIDPFNVVVDAGKNIWALASGSVRIVTTDRTIEVRLPGTIVGGARQVTQIASLGDGQYVFLRGAAGDTFYAKLAATGEPEFRIGPKIWDRGPEACRDTAGGLWLTIKDASGHKVVDARDTGITVRRVAVRGRAQNFPDVGLPVLVDDSGCVWLAPATANDGSTVTLWVPSGKTTTVTIPRRAAGSSLVAAGKGRVLAVTKDGLQELLADRTDQPENYALGKLYALDVPDGEDVRSLQYTSLGYLVGTSGNVDVGGVHTMLCLFNLDRASAGPEDARAAKTAESTTKSDAPASGDPRTWHDAGGRHSLKATFVSAETGIVRLRKADGSTVDVPIDKLSDEDRKYIISTRAGTERKKDRP